MQRMHRLRLVRDIAPTVPLHPDAFSTTFVILLKIKSIVFTIQIRQQNIVM
jgi:hypothetical protein